MLVERVFRDGPLVMGEGVGGGIFELQHQIPCMDFFRPKHEYFLGLTGVHEFFFI